MKKPIIKNNQAESFPQEQILNLQGSPLFISDNQHLASQLQLFISNVKEYAIYLLDPNGNIVSWNIGAERLKGYTTNEIIGKNFAIFYSDEEQFTGLPQKILKIATKTGQYSGEGYRFRKDGTSFWASIVITPLKDASNTITGFIKITRNITDKKEQKEKIEQVKQQYMDYFNDAGDAILLFNKRTKIQNANKKASEILGYSQKELLTMSVKKLIESEDLRTYPIQFKKLSTDKSFTLERKIIRKDGRYVYVEINSKLIENNIVEAIFRDITEKKQAEQEIKDLNTKITAMINSISDGFFSLDNQWRFTYFNKVAEQILPYQGDTLIGRNIWELYPGLIGTLAEKNYKKAYKKQKPLSFKLDSLTGKIYQVHCYPSPDGLSVFFTDITIEEAYKKRQTDFISIASHELKTPISVLVLYSEILKKHPSNLIQQQAIKNISEQILKLQTLSSDLLDSSSIQTGKMRLKKESFSLTKLVKDMAKNSQQIALQHHIKVEGNITQKITADKTKLAQVLTNLINNAIKYSPGAKQLIITMSKTDTTAIVSVKDFGNGIPKEKQQKIFSQFYRTEEGEHMSNGLGLGLFISQNIVQAHKGKLWVKSDGKTGSTFYFSIPFDKKKKV